jgi:hypothetical protein
LEALHGGEEKMAVGGDVFHQEGNDTGWQTLTATATEYDFLPGIEGINGAETYQITLQAYVRIIGNEGVYYDIQANVEGAGWVTLNQGAFGVSSHGATEGHYAIQTLDAVLHTGDTSDCVWLRFRFGDYGGAGTAYVTKNTQTRWIVTLLSDDKEATPPCR